MHFRATVTIGTDVVNAAPAHETGKVSYFLVGVRGKGLIFKVEVKNGGRQVCLTTMLCSEAVGSIDPPTIKGAVEASKLLASQTFTVSGKSFMKPQLSQTGGIIDDLPLIESPFRQELNIKSTGETCVFELFIV